MQLRTDGHVLSSECQDCLRHASLWGSSYLLQPLGMMLGMTVMPPCLNLG